MKLYVLGFMFNKNMDKVLLIHKNKPDWQKGSCNGIGGKIEKNELPINAMIREFKEETGIKTNTDIWSLFLIMAGSEWKVYTFCSVGNIKQAKSITSEKIEIFSLNDISTFKIKIISNLIWITHMAYNFLHKKGIEFSFVEYYK
jgi:8-oxo-dGTP diphosphatase